MKTLFLIQTIKNTNFIIKDETVSRARIRSKAIFGKVIENPIEKIN